jgi:hypothetical protein
VQAALAARPAAAFHSVLILNEEGREYERIDNILRERGEIHLWYLEGGLRAYRQELKRQERIAEGRKNPNSVCTKAAGCSSCR